MEIFDRILGIILPVFFIIAIGYGYGRVRGAAVKADMIAVNTVSMDALCPLLVFTALAARDFNLAANASLIAGGALVALGSGLLAWPVARLLGYDMRTFLPPMMYNNCGNMGLPLAVLAFGPGGLSAAVAMFMACNVVYFTLGIKIIESGGKQHVSPWAFLKNPMMLAMFAGLFFALLRIPIPAPLFQAMKLLGDASIPIMLFALGVRMLDIRFDSWKIGVTGAIVCPVAGLLVALGLDHVLVLNAAQRGQLFLFASLPPAVFCFMVAERYQQEPDKVASIVMIGNLAALLFVPLGLWLGLR
ncbi:AEC family transporter [Actimicrobium sp. CCC2.4]|uniref:AEC family transporter n=1 Tax=Actimicrobium sp. CCC2.4 TaxID=3048606 RepID=UPI002AC8CE14|nr:AEC family transporter [Actimicrobium sp. CCC2.4]MEB0135601.1 AEC family transporter [Actimicrobium sp. CCC2.4]WPX33835.1 AEC family transporter [Actimicrobium sp. CCC2.4]